MTVLADERLNEKVLGHFHASDFPAAANEFCENCPFSEGCWRSQNPSACALCLTNALSSYFVLDESELTVLLMGKFLLWSDGVERTQAIEANRIVA
jgi:hypothetical protein